MIDFFQAREMAAIGSSAFFPIIFHSVKCPRDPKTRSRKKALGKISWRVKNLGFIGDYCKACGKKGINGPIGISNNWS
jgi:hypothetical protein